MNFKKRLNPPKMTKSQKKVYSYLKRSKFHKKYKHWTNFTEINKVLKKDKKKIEDKLDSCMVTLDERKVLQRKMQDLAEIEKNLVFERLKEFKEEVDRNSKKHSYNKRLTCFYCEEIMDDKVDKNNNFNTIEHIIDKGSHPEYSFSPFNLIPICNACNLNKGTLSVIVYDDNKSLSEKDYLIIHPYLDDKKDCLKNNKLKSWEVVETSSALLKEKAMNTIMIYDLLRTRIPLNKNLEEIVEEIRINYQSILENTKVDDETKNLIGIRNTWRQ